jgi:sugar phosphate isomerase/epimerase
MVNDTKIAVQLFTLRDYLKTPADVVGTMKKLSKLGYGAVELACVCPMEPKELKKITDGEGIKICSTHIGAEQIVNDVQSVIDEYKLLDCEHVGIGGLPEKYRNRDGYKQFCQYMSPALEKLHKNGFSFVYHNHSFELEKYDGLTGLDILFRESNPKTFMFEIDTYWVQHGGGCPAGWIKKLNPRVPCVHLKDMVFGQGGQLIAEVGEGNLDWKSILDVCKASGVEWYIVEQDTCQRDPFESVGISIRNLKTMGIK